MDVRPEQQPVVEAVLATVSDRTNMRRLKHRWYVRSADRAAAVIGIEHHCPEGTLAEPVRRPGAAAEASGSTEQPTGRRGRSSCPGRCWAGTVQGAARRRLLERSGRLARTDNR